MSFPLTIENLSQLQRLAKDVQRLSRAIIYSETGSFEPRNVGDATFDSVDSPQPDIATVRANVAAAADIYAALTVLVNAVCQYVL